MEPGTSPLPDHRLEPELEPATPRPIPDVVLNGPWARRRRVALRLWAAGGLAALLLGRTEACSRLAEAVLPLGYLDVGGAVTLVVVALVRVWRAVALAAPLRLFQDGEVLVGRIVDLSLVPRAIRNNVVSTVGYDAAVMVELPQGARRFVVTSPDLSADLQRSIEMTLRVGDAVTLLRLPGAPGLEASLYGFLELTDDSTALRRGVATALRRLELVLVISGMLGSLFFGLAALWLYEPLDMPGWLFGAAGGLTLVASLGSLAYLRRARRAQDEEFEQLDARRRAGGPEDLVPRRPIRPLGLAALCSPLWFLVCFAALVFANGALDEAPGQLRPARVVRLTEKTNFAGPIPLLREYEVEWTPLGGGRKETTNQPLARMSGLAEGEPAAVEVAPGALGVPWARAIFPASLDGADLVVDVDGRLERLSPR